MGKQAQIIAMFSSMMVHRVEAISTKSFVSINGLSSFEEKGGKGVSQVVSGLVVEKLRVVARRIDVTVTLQLLVMCLQNLERYISLKIGETHKLPRANTNIRALFWLMGSLLAQMGCIGSNKIKTSVAME
jgi:hypothetical protein